jgi:GNAT superfamily N-acetyltransferase
VEVAGLLASEEAVLLVAVDATDMLQGVIVGKWHAGAVGCVFGHPLEAKVLTFGTLSVPARYGGQGRGRALVAAMERVLAERCPFVDEVPLTIDIVATLGPRKENLVGFYASLAYEISGPQDPAYWSFAIDDAWKDKIFAQRMHKTLSRIRA